MTMLPTIVCFKSTYNNKYLRYRTDDVQAHGLFQFAGEKVMDPYAQFEVIKARTGDGLVHLKSRYANKYLVRLSPNHYWITASADAPDEDQCKWTCTLFRPIQVNKCDSTTIRLVHVQLGHYACLWRTSAPFDSCLFAGSKTIDKDSCDVIKVVDWERVSKLPQHVAFKGDNGKYLGVVNIKGQHVLQFSYCNTNDSRVGQQIFTSADGIIYIKSDSTGKFWRLGDGNRICVDANDPRCTNNACAMFRPSVIDINIFAIMNMSSQLFCKRYTDCDESLLSGIGKTIDDPCARLEVIDLKKGCYC